MIVESLTVGPLEVGCYIIGCGKKREVAVVDPGGDPEKIAQTVESMGLKPVIILATHGHFDHIGGANLLQEITGCRFMINGGDTELVDTLERQAEFFGFDMANKPRVDGHLNDGDNISVGNLQLTVLETPGHTCGSVSFLCNDSVFVGDTVFRGSIGRTDLPGGSYETLINSVREKLFVLDDDTMIFPGHGPASTILDEKRYNPFLNTLVL